MLESYQRTCRMIEFDHVLCIKTPGIPEKQKIRNKKCVAYLFFLAAGVGIQTENNRDKRTQTIS